MARILVPRELMGFFNDFASIREIQRFFEQVSFTSEVTTGENNTKIIKENTTLTSEDGSITINASVNDVKIKLPDPNTYKGIIYRIDVLDDTNRASVSGRINNEEIDFQLFVEESLILQDNGSSFRTK